MNVGSGGGAAPAAAGGAGGATGGDAPAEEKKEEKEEGMEALRRVMMDKTNLGNREGGVRRRHGLRSVRLSAFACDFSRIFLHLFHTGPALHLHVYTPLRAG